MNFKRCRSPVGTPGGSQRKRTRLEERFGGMSIGSGAPVSRPEIIPQQDFFFSFPVGSRASKMEVDDAEE